MYNPAKIGIFRVPLEYIEKYREQVKELCSCVLILKADYLIHKQCIEYVGECDQFREVYPGCEPFVYSVHFVNVNDEGIKLALCFD